MEISNPSEKSPLPFTCIIDCLYTSYGITVKKLSSLALGADINASVYKTETTEGLSYFVKLKRGHLQDLSIAILPLLQASGIEQIILPIKAGNGELTQHIEDYTLSVYPFIDGKNGFCHTLTKDQWISLGRSLRKIHDFAVPPAIQSQIKQEVYANRWREAVLSLYSSSISPVINDEITTKLQTFMKTHRTTILHLVDRAECLSKKIRLQSPAFVLCHSDIHGGNVLIQEDNKALYIVDWDDPIMAPKERDLMFIGGGVANVWNNKQEEEYFYQGYGKTVINRTILSYYRYERIVEDIAEYNQALLMTTGNQNRQELFKQFMDMFELNGVVDIACKT